MKKYIIVLVVALIGWFSFSFTTSQYFEISKNLEIFTTLYKEINTFYVDDIDPNEFIQTGIDAMLNSLDPYTTYYPESEIENYRFQTTGKYGGIGSFIKRKDDYVIISEPYENSPATKAGLLAGDKVIAIDDKPIKGKSSDEVSKLLKGQPNTKLMLKILRPQLDGTDKEMQIEVLREEVKMNNVTYFGLVENDFGYIKLTNFTQDAAKEVENAVLDLKKQNAQLKGIILDVRGNPGGLLTEAVDITNIFLAKNQLVCFTKGKVADWDKDFKTRKEPIDKEIPFWKHNNSNTKNQQNKPRKNKILLRSNLPNRCCLFPAQLRNRNHLWKRCRSKLNKKSTNKQRSKEKRTKSLPRSLETMRSQRQTNLSAHPLCHHKLRNKESLF